MDIGEEVGGCLKNKIVGFSAPAHFIKPFLLCDWAAVGARILECDFIAVGLPKNVGC